MMLLIADYSEWSTVNRRIRVQSQLSHFVCLQLRPNLIEWRDNFDCLLEASILPFMPGTTKIRESRRSTRVPLKITVEVESSPERLTCDGETVVVNLHGALISTSLTLNVGMKISIHVFLTDKRARARVVYVDPENPRLCGIALEKPENIWGVSLPPDDWDETKEMYAAH